MEINISDHYTGERLSFFSLFSEKNYHVEIPIIQRDYAQGRASAAVVRDTFLDALYEYLKENSPNRDLDFVYGSLIEDGEEVRFIPLDGQQRLTTLFLIHLYLAYISDNVEKFKEVLTKNGKSKFTYETRTSSREFCEALLSNEIDFKAILSSKQKDRVSSNIRNCGWYYLSWGNDPTIQSMLNMLDAIDNKFSGNPEFFDPLISKDNPIITFLFLNLKKFKLTDDLYIKMNARGKPLTPFENLKAKLEQHIGNLNWEAEKPFYLDFGEVKNKVSAREYFSFKIDTKWANLFWNYKDPKTKLYDTQLMNFIRVIFSNQYSIDLKSDRDEIVELLIGTQVARKKIDYSDNIGFSKYQSFGLLTTKSINYLIGALDKLSSENKKAPSFLSDTYYYNEEKIVEKVMSHGLTLTQRIQFHAYIKYLVNQSFYTGINDWMRVIHNLTENTIIDGAEEVTKAIKSIEKLLPHSENILEFLKTDIVQIDFYSSWQVTEERIKAHLITKSGDWQKAIAEIEKHGYFDGQIGFILKFSGIWDYFANKSNCEWTNDENVTYFNSFIDYSIKSKSIFGEKGLELFPDNLWERALLTKGFYLLVSGSNFSFLFNNHRDISWKRLLRGSERYGDIHDTKRLYIKDLWDDSRFDPLNSKLSLETIINGYSGDEWYKFLIQYSELIKECYDRYIRVNSPNFVLLLNRSATNGYHSEYYTFALKTRLERLGYEVHYHRDASIDYPKYISNINGKDVEITYSPLESSYNVTIIISSDVSWGGLYNEDEVINYLMTQGVIYYS